MQCTLISLDCYTIFGLIMSRLECICVLFFWEIKTKACVFDVTDGLWGIMGWDDVHFGWWLTSSLKEVEAGMLACWFGDSWDQSCCFWLWECILIILFSRNFLISAHFGTTFFLCQNGTKNGFFWGMGFHFELVILQKHAVQNFMAT